MAQNSPKDTIAISRCSSATSDEFRLTRNLSIPANFKLQLKEKKQSRSRYSKEALKMAHSEACDLTSAKRCQQAATELPDCQMKRRHSDRDLRNLESIPSSAAAAAAAAASSEASSGSLPVTSLPGSLRASDSAFSQSRTTLESGDEADRRSSYSRSLDESELTKDNCSAGSAGSTSRIIMINDISTSTSSNSSSSSGSTSGKLLISDCERTKNQLQLIPFENDNVSSDKIGDPRDGFRIIWRDLTFRVPEKQFSQLNTCWQRCKESLWASSETAAAAGTTLSAELSLSEAPQVPISGIPRKVIFDKLNGCAESGKLTAILGPSGAGKTTLLNCLTAGLVKGVSGSILVSDFGCKATRRRRLKLCIIPQKDYLFDKLTVMENLLFASRLKNTQQAFDHPANVQRVTSLLGLQACLALKTGKLSGGQYKRVSIAQELLSKPDILILDEPTSGLDSLTCFRTVSVLCDLVNMSRAGLVKPLAIIMTIHQPQMKVFNLFHHVYIMSSLGACVYEGTPEDLEGHVARSCQLLPPPDDPNPASFIIDLASQVYGAEPLSKLTRLQRENFCAIHDQENNDYDDDGDKTLGDIKKTTSTNNLQEQKKDNCQLAIFIGGHKNMKPVDEEKEKKCDNIRVIGGDGGGFAVSECLRRCNNHDRCFWLHTRLLVQRLWVAMWRDPLLATTRISFHLLIPFVFYFIYSQKSGEANACPLVERELDIQTMTSEETLQRLQVQHNELILTFENVSLFFLLLYSFSMCVLAITALSFPLNMQILLKETSNGWYSMSRFVMAKTIADLPLELAMPIISVSMAYFLTGQPGSYLSWRMLTITGVMTLCSLISQTQGLLFGAYFMNNVQAAVFISQASSLPWIMLSGFTTRVIELPAVLRWLSFGSIYRLGIESIVAARYGFGMCPCDKELVDDKPTKLVGISDQLKSVMRYYFEMYAEQQQAQEHSLQAVAGMSNNKTTTIMVTPSLSPTTSPAETTGGAPNSSDDILERLASTMSRANTYGAEIVTCHDVKPFIMSARGVEETTLPKFILILIIIFVALKILLFFVVRLRAGR